MLLVLDGLRGGHICEIHAQLAVGDAAIPVLIEDRKSFLELLELLLGDLLLLSLLLFLLLCGSLLCGLITLLLGTFELRHFNFNYNEYRWR